MTDWATAMHAWRCYVVIRPVRTSAESWHDNRRPSGNQVTWKNNGLAVTRDIPGADIVPQSSHTVASIITISGVHQHSRTLARVQSTGYTCSL